MEKNKENVTEFKDSRQIRDSRDSSVEKTPFVMTPLAVPDSKARKP